VLVVAHDGRGSSLLGSSRRWTATGASYQTVPSPPVTILLAAWLLGEPVNPRLAVGTLIVLAGVYAGALSHPRAPTP